MKTTQVSIAIGHLVGALEKEIGSYETIRIIQNLILDIGQARRKRSREKLQKIRDKK